MAIHRRYDILAIIAIAVAIAAYASVRSEFRLRSTMPQEFFDSTAVAPARRGTEEKIAKAYWRCAVAQIQWKYGYGHRLPDEPPEEFAVLPEDGGATKDSALRAHYWQKLRDVWGISAVWNERYEWDSSSLRNSMFSAGNWMERHMRRIAGY